MARTHARTPKARTQPESTHARTQERETCPNCARRVTLASIPKDACILEAMMNQLADRDEHTDEQLRAIWHEVDTDTLWDDLGEVLDRLGRGEYARVLHGE